ncbi:MAG: flagellar hook-associated protein FlgK [Syntrophomonadaceae bacterium]|nr:flagellar hook-associated protein FlgK [Syntrophomonadaceae bacterium]
MGNLLFGLNTALKGMTAQQASLNVLSHNIANANTPGYTRQRAILETSYPISGLCTAGQMGTGVEVGQIQRIREQFIDYQLRKEYCIEEKWESITNILEQVEMIFMEPTESGFNEMMNTFWNDWLELSDYAELSPIRTNLKESAGYMADAFRQMSSHLKVIKDDIVQQHKMTLAEVNLITKQVADLNQQIFVITATGDSPNDLIDRRDLLLDELGKLAPIAVTPVVNPDGDPTGSIDVTINGAKIVDDRVARLISLDDSSIDTGIIIEGEMDPVMVEQGKIGGLRKTAGLPDLDTYSIDHYLQKLDSLAVSLAKAVNDIHKQGIDLNGEQGENFFVFLDIDGNEIDLDSIDWNDPLEAGLGAGNIHVNPLIMEDVSKIAAGQKQGDLFLPGNGNIALKISQLKDARLKYDPAKKVAAVDPDGTTTFGGFYADSISELGSASRAAIRNLSNQQALVTQMENRRESVSGVSLDEEMAHMLQYQHAYAANAKVIQTIDELLVTLINLVR